jgi:hypothetical protein
MTFSFKLCRLVDGLDTTTIVIIVVIQQLGNLNGIFQIYFPTFN